MLLVKPAWGFGGGILTLLAVFGEKVFPVGHSAATGIGVLFAARGIGTAVGPIVARRISGEGAKRMQTSIGIAFLIGGLFYIAFGSTTNFVIALIVLGIAHMGGSILWVYSTVLLQREVEDGFRGRVFAAELALLNFDNGRFKLCHRRNAGSLRPVAPSAGDWPWVVSSSFPVLSGSLPRVGGIETKLRRIRKQNSSMGWRGERSRVPR